LDLYRKQHRIDKDAKEERRRALHRSPTAAR
jgi:hypothetical protein